MTSSTPGPAVEKTASVTAEGETYPSGPKRLTYVDVPAPQPGSSVMVAPGVLWCRIPLPIDLNHINVWLLDTAQGRVLVDTGLAAAVGKAAWEAIEVEAFRTQPLCAIFITHIHPDHIGLAGWLQERHRVPVLMSKRTHELAEVMLGGKAAPAEAEAEAFFRSNGVTDPAMLRPMFSPARFAKLASGMPQVERFIADNEALQWQPHAWTALETNGHAEGHLCLSNAADGLLISGDQVLPTISSNISFNWRNGDPNPLQSFLASLRRLRGLSSETLVLPSHGIPFRGLQQRIDDLLQHHAEQLDSLVRACMEPQSAAEILPVMFRRELSGMHLFLALGEALAHLEYLVQEGRVERRTDATGLIRYASV